MTSEKHHPFILPSTQSMLLVIDIQEKFRKAIQGFEAIESNAGKLIQGFQLLGLPVVITEQYPKGLGPTTAALQQCCPQVRPIAKETMSSCGCSAFLETLSTKGFRHIVVCGIETHVCVSQTVLDLMYASYVVHVVVDAIGSRKQKDHETGLAKMFQASALPTTVEMALFELTKKSGTELFKKVQQLIR
ncbi:MAG: hydrolase [Chitinivibrionales bacterium]|nr:hydrolase [Chitinivibrionales bacterium]